MSDVTEGVASVRYRLRRAGLSFRSDVVEGPGGRQILLAYPAGNLIELFTPAR